MRHLLPAFFIAISSVVPTFGQLQGTLAPQPIGIAFAKNVSQQQSMEYIAKLTEQLKIGETLWAAIQQEEVNEKLKETTPDVPEPISGTATYMVQAIIPSFTSVSFQDVADEVDAKRVLKAQARMMGNESGVEDEGDGRYKLVQSNSWDQPIAEGQDAEQEAENVRNMSTGQMKYTAEPFERDGKQFLKRTWSMTTYYRYSDGLLFSSQFPELWDMQLPTQDTILRSAEGENDMGAEAFFDRIPTAIKTLGWNMLNSTAGVQMQQRDGEHNATANLRETSIRFGLNLVRSVMFDVDEARGWLKWADDDIQSIRATLEFSTRRNSSLTLKLEEMASANSRFGPLLSEEAPALAHLCVKLFDEDDPMVRAAADWLVYQIENVASGDSQLLEASQNIAESIRSIAQERTLELFLQAGWSEESDGFLLGGIQADNNPRLLEAVYAFVEWTNRSERVDVSLAELQSRQVIRIELPEQLSNDVQASSGIRVSHIYLSHDNSCLWLAIGTANVHHALSRAVSICESRGAVTRTPLCTARLDVDHWLSLPQDDPSGIPGLLQWLDENESRFPPSPMSFGFSASLSGTEKPTPLLQRCLDLGGDRNGSFRIVADKSGLMLDATLGEALGNYFLARQLDSQDRMMRRNQQNIAVPAEAETTEAKEE